MGGCAGQLFNRTVNKDVRKRTPAPEQSTNPLFLRQEECENPLHEANAFSHSCSKSYTGRVFSISAVWAICNGSK